MLARRVLAALLALALAVLAAGCGGGDTKTTTGAVKPPSSEPIRIGSKNFTEQAILGELYRQALRSKGYNVVLKPDIGSTEIIHRTLRAGSLDMYPEYVGALSEFASRFEGLRGLREVYGLTHLTVRRVDSGGRYAALDGGDVDVASVFSSDGQLVGGRYTVLKDPRGLFASGHVAPIISQ